MSACAHPAGHCLFATSPGMREVIDLATRAAATRDGVLIGGEPGTGRDAVARLIHQTGGSTASSFVAVDCIRKPAHTEEELFGASNGDLPRARRKAFEAIVERSAVDRARGGTLLVRHLQEMPDRIQGRLLRVLRDGEAVLLPSGRNGHNGNRGAAGERVPVDVRLVAVIDGSPQSAQKAAAEGRVRPELLRRVSAFRIVLPPLRRRREDIPDLASYLLDQACAAAGRDGKILDRAVVTFLAALPWRGNGHELRGLLEVLANRVPGALIHLEDVLPYVRLDGGFFPATGNGTLKAARARFEHDYIVAMLQQHHGRIAEVARVLGLQRPNLYRKMRALKVVSAARRRTA